MPSKGTQFDLPVWAHLAWERKHWLLLKRNKNQLSVISCRIKSTYQYSHWLLVFHFCVLFPFQQTSTDNSPQEYDFQTLSVGLDIDPLFHGLWGGRRSHQAPSHLHTSAGVLVSVTLSGQQAEDYSACVPSLWTCWRLIAEEEEK
jgi:hypothetical protein